MADDSALKTQFQLHQLFRILHPHRGKAAPSCPQAAHDYKGSIT
jgi:hypothetical protein